MKKNKHNIKGEHQLNKLTIDYLLMNEEIT